MECIVAFWEGVLEGRLASRGVCFKGSGLVWWRSFLIDLGPNAGDDGLALCGKQATYYITCLSNPPVRGRGMGGEILQNESLYIHLAVFPVEVHKDFKTSPLIITNFFFFLFLSVLKQ